MANFYRLIFVFLAVFSLGAFAAIPQTTQYLAQVGNQTSSMSATPSGACTDAFNKWRIWFGVDAYGAGTRFEQTSTGFYPDPGNNSCSARAGSATSWWYSQGGNVYTVSACPANSTASGSSCVCTSPYVEDVTHTKCEIPQNCPVGQVIAATVSLGWFASGSDASYKTPTSLCTQQGAYKCSASFGPPGGSVSVVAYSPTPPVNGYTDWYVAGSGTLTGAECSGPVTPSINPLPAPPCVGQLGTVNGISVCIPNESAAAREARAQSAAASAASQASADATVAGAIPAVVAAAAAAAGSAASSTVRSGGTSASAAAAGKAAGDAVVAGGTSASALAAAAGSAAGAAAASAATAAGLSPAVVKAASDAAASAASSAAAAAAAAGKSVAEAFAAGQSAGASAGSAAAQAANAAAARAMADALAAGKTAAEQAAAGAAAAAALAAANAANVAAVKAAGDAALAQAIAAGQTAAQQAAAVLAAQQAAAASALAAARQAAEAAAQAAGKDAAAIAAAGEAAAAAAAAALKASNDALNKALDALAAEAAKKAEKPPNPLDEFCANNPGSPMCKEVVDSKFTAACGAPPTCEGDAILCAIGAAVFESNCLFKQETDESKLYDAKKGLTGDQTASLPGNETVAIGPSSFNQDPLIGAGTGLADFTITVMGKTITVPMSGINIWLSRIGSIFVACTFLLCARIVARG